MNQQLEQNRVLTESFKGGVIMDVTMQKKQKLHKKRALLLLWHWNAYLPILENKAEWHV